LPIPRSEFNSGKAVDPIQDQILEFLSKHRDSTYTTVEIVRQVIQPAENTFSDFLRFGGHLAAVAASLDVLLKDKKVVGKIVHVGSVRDVYFTVP
jgi:hypothetical protein